MRRPKRFQAAEQVGTWDKSISTIAAVYGANASGKSTFVNSIQYLKNAVSNSYINWGVDGGTQCETFKLSNERELSPTEFEIEFRGEDGFDYQYGFQADSEQFLQEWLYVYRTSSRTMLYERGLNYNHEIKFGNSFRGNKNEIEQIIKTRPNALSLSVGAQLGNTILMPVYRWITNRLSGLTAEGFRHGFPFTAERVEKDNDFKSSILSILAKADLGVSDIQIEASLLDENTVNQGRRFVRAINPDIPEEEVNRMVDQNAKEIKLSHIGENGPVKFPFGWESTGTQALFSFAGVAFDALEKGSCLVIDELGTSLHSLLVLELLELFLDPTINTKQAQLIFTTHDTSLLHPKSINTFQLDRDQVWLAEKDSNGASSLTPLIQYKAPRKEENLERGYLLGRYGGIPKINFGFGKDLTFSTPTSA